MKKIFSLALLLFLIMTLASCCGDFADQREEMCNKTPCTDSLCMHWDSTINRCGTSIALFKEKQRQNLVSTVLLEHLIDSLLDAQINIVKKENEKRMQSADLGLTEIGKKYKVPQKVLDSIREITEYSSLYMEIENFKKKTKGNLKASEFVNTLFDSNLRNLQKEKKK